MTNEFNLFRQQMEALRISINTFNQAEKLFANGEMIHKALESVLIGLEYTTITARNLFEKTNDNEVDSIGEKSAAAYAFIAGDIKVTEDNLIAIKINTLIPHCRLRPPEYLIDTLDRLLRNYKSQSSLPSFEKAMVVIDEHSSEKNRNIYDQDNKGWKAIPNVIKLHGIVEDDNQTCIDIALMTTESANNITCIYIMDAGKAPDFFIKKRRNDLPFLEGSN